MTEIISKESRDQIFTDARTHGNWQEKDVPETLIRNLLPHMGKQKKEKKKSTEKSEKK